MRIAAVSPFIDKHHGTERAFAELLERLAHFYGCEVHLYSQSVQDIAVRDPRAARPMRENRIENSAQLGATYDVPGQSSSRQNHKARSSTEKNGAIFWHRVPAVRGPQFLRFLSWLALNSIQRRVDTSFRRLSFDLTLSVGINCLDADLIIVHALFRRLREVSESRLAPRRSLGSRLRLLHRRAYYALLDALERRIYGNRDVALAAVCRATADRLADYFQRRDVRVVPNGVNTSEFNPPARLALRAEARRSRKLTDNDFVLLLIGNDWHTKGLRTILQAMALCNDISLSLVVAGEDWLPAAQETAKRAGQLERVLWEAPRKDVIQLYAVADVYVSPSHEDAFPLPVIESMACGLPVISSTRAGISAYIEDGVDGFVLRDPNDHASLANMLRMLYEQNELRARMGAAAVRTASHWTWDRNAANLWEFIQQSASERKAR